MDAGARRGRRGIIGAKRMSRIGRNIQMRRDRLGLTQAQLGTAVGYSDGSMIAQIEGGVKSPTLDKAQDIAIQLGISLSELVGETVPVHTVTNHASGDHTVIQNIEGHYCGVQQEALRGLVQDIVQAAMTELTATLTTLLTATLQEILAAHRDRQAPP